MKHASIQAEYARIQKADPGQFNQKHMIDRETYFVIGQTIDKNVRYANLPLAVAAYSSKFKPHERVDTMYYAGAGTHFGLNLPEGDYQLLVFADRNKNQIFDQTEVIGQKTISLNQMTSSDKVLDQIEIQLSSPQRVDWAEAISKPNLAEPQQSLFFPTGSIRSLDDPVPSKNCVPVEGIEHASVSVHHVSHDCNAVYDPDFRPFEPSKTGLREPRAAASDRRTATQCQTSPSKEA